MEWNPSRALGFGLKVTLDRSVVEPEGAIELRIGQIFKLDQLPASPVVCTVDLVVGTAVKETTRLVELMAVGPDLAANPATSHIVIPRDTSGNYQLHLTLKPSTGDPASKTMT